VQICFLSWFAVAIAAPIGLRRLTSLISFSLICFYSSVFLLLFKSVFLALLCSVSSEIF
ncbi:hypothetical protein CCACVL1_18331, partial [Corchorus capsularis]